MQSTGIERIAGIQLSVWHDLTTNEITRVPSAEGIYAIRIANGKEIGRLKGKSDLVYIGSGNLKGRLKCHTDFRADLRDKGWLLYIIARYEPLEFSWSRCDHCADIENKLLLSYLFDHLELPPANNRLTLSKELQHALTIWVAKHVGITDEQIRSTLKSAQAGT